MQDIFGSRKFLLVEDFETMRSVIRGLLRRCGAERVDTAASADEASKLLARERYDVVLCDYNLGVGKNGQMLLEESRFKQWTSPTTVWIMITAEKNSDMIFVAAEHAPDDYLLKPITEGTLQTRLQRLLARKAALADIVAAMQAKDYARVVYLCNQRKPEGKNLADLLRLQAQAYELSGDAERAIATYHDVLDRADIAWAKLGIARIKAAKGDEAGARALLEEIVSAHPQYLEAYDGLAQLLERRGELDRQLEILQRATKLSPNSAARQAALGQVAVRSGQLELAGQAFSRSIKLAEHSAMRTPAAQLGLARVQSETGSPQDALQTLAAVERDFDAPEARLLAKTEALRAHVKAGDEAAIQAAQAQLLALTVGAAEAVPTEAAMQVAETLMQLGRQSVATELLQFVARNNHEDQSVAERAQRVFESGGMGDAGRELLSASRKQAAEAMSEGVQLLGQGKLPEALDSMRRARALMPQNSRALLNLAYVAVVSLEKTGWDATLGAEARAAIALAQGLAPGNARAAELHGRLQKVAPAH
ncbi:MAG: response regulator [Pelomonas sp.]|nr:response regulator [Roseateles sp.]